MNLAQVIRHVPCTKPMEKEKVEFVERLRRDIESMERYQETNRLPIVGELKKQLVGRVLEYRLNGYDGSNVGTVLDELPTTDTKSVRALAEQIGFAVIPLPYLRDEFWPEYDVKRSILALDEVTDVWVMAPIVAYDLGKHVAHKRDITMFVPSDAAQAFMAIGMSVPVFRSLQDQINEMEMKQRERIDKLRQELNGMRARLNEVAEHVVALRAVEDERAKKAEEEAHRRHLTALYARMDPLAIALPHRKTIKDDTIAFVGPCWGELPEELVETFGLKKRSGR